MNKVNVFISHRSQDVKLANVISKHLREWGIEEKAIFQSTDPKRGLGPGSTIKAELEKKLADVNILILLYTDPEARWFYCMWECGVAQGKSSIKTKTIVFQCTEEEPAVFEGELRVIISEIEIKRFVENFHRKPGFIPSAKKEEKPVAFAPDIGDDLIQTRSERLYEELVNHIPSGTSSSRHMWDFIRLRLDSDFVKKIENIKEKKGKNAREDITNIIAENFEIKKPQYSTVGGNVDTALKQFGFASFEDGMKLDDLIVRWKESDESEEHDWISDLYGSIYNSLTNSPSVPSNNMMKSVRIGVEWWFLPIVTRIRSYRDGSCEFDLYLVLSKTSALKPLK
ncbi:MAG: toll/interleukin-1 receptor domain-containing protein [Kangiellaceae bacterium]|nr:toll/interleukin-1 receptor domain-containing protein [Kangiellaceae bacterium]